MTALENVKKMISDSEVEIIPSWGDILVPKKLMYSSKEHLFNNKNDMRLLLDYYYSCLTDKLLSNSAFIFSY